MMGRQPDLLIHLKSRWLGTMGIQLVESSCCSVPDGDKYFDDGLLGRGEVEGRRRCRGLHVRIQRLGDPNDGCNRHIVAREKTAKGRKAFSRHVVESEVGGRKMEGELRDKGQCSEFGD